MSAPITPNLPLPPQSMIVPVRYKCGHWETHQVANPREHTHLCESASRSVCSACWTKWLFGSEETRAQIDHLFRRVPL